MECFLTANEILCYSQKSSEMPGMKHRNSTYLELTKY